MTRKACPKCRGKRFWMNIEGTDEIEVGADNATYFISRVRLAYADTYLTCTNCDTDLGWDELVAKEEEDAEAQSPETEEAHESKIPRELHSNPERETGLGLLG